MPYLSYFYSVQIFLHNLIAAGPEQKDLRKLYNSILSASIPNIIFYYLEKYLDNFNYGGNTAEYGKFYNNSGDGNDGDHGSLFTKDGIYGNIAQGWGSGTTWFPYLVTPLAAFTSRAADDDIRVIYSLNNYNLKQASTVAKSADIAFVFVGARYVKK